MSINNDEVGLRRDLFEEAKPGMIDTSSVSTNWFTFIDHEWEALQQDFFEKPLDDLLVDLVSIFRKGNPNYINLGSLFGTEKKKVDEQNKIVYSVNQVNRRENDIAKVTMFLDPDSHKIIEIYFYMQVSPSINQLKNRLEETYSDLFFNTGSELVIIDKDFKLTLKK